MKETPQEVWARCGEAAMAEFRKGALFWHIPELTYYTFEVHSVRRVRPSDTIDWQIICGDEIVESGAWYDL
ncbi:MAG: hypothetical protein ACYDD1_05430 [Caulobacteraceae bacterium]